MTYPYLSDPLFPVERNVRFLTLEVGAFLTFFFDLEGAVFSLSCFPNICFPVLSSPKLLSSFLFFFMFSAFSHSYSDIPLIYLIGAGFQTGVLTVACMKTDETGWLCVLS